MRGGSLRCKYLKLNKRKPTDLGSSLNWMIPLQTAPSFPSLLQEQMWDGTWQDPYREVDWKTSKSLICLQVVVFEIYWFEMLLFKKGTWLQENAQVTCSSCPELLPIQHRVISWVATSWLLCTEETVPNSIAGWEGTRKPQADVSAKPASCLCLFLSPLSWARC